MDKQLYKSIQRLTINGRTREAMFGSPPTNLPDLSEEIKTTIKSKRCEDKC